MLRFSDRPRSVAIGRISRDIRLRRVFVDRGESSMYASMGLASRLGQPATVIPSYGNSGGRSTFRRPAFAQLEHGYRLAPPGRSKRQSPGHAIVAPGLFHLAMRSSDCHHKRTESAHNCIAIRKPSYLSERGARMNWWLGGDDACFCSGRTVKRLLLCWERRSRRRSALVGSARRRPHLAHRPLPTATAVARHDTSLIVEKSFRPLTGARFRHGEPSEYRDSRSWGRARPRQIGFAVFGSGSRAAAARRQRGCRDPRTSCHQHLQASARYFLSWEQATGLRIEAA